MSQQSKTNTDVEHPTWPFLSSISSKTIVRNQLQVRELPEVLRIKSNTYRKRLIDIYKPKQSAPRILKKKHIVQNDTC